MPTPPLTDGGCHLPVGLVVEDGRRLSRAELRAVGGREEEWLAGHPAAPAALAVTRLLGACLVRLDDAAGSPELVRRLLVTDRDYLMLQLRSLTLGERFQAVFACPACSSRMDVSFTSSDVPVECRPQAAAAYSVDLPDPRPSGRAVRFRLPTGADQESALGMAPEAAADALLDRCTLDDGGAPLTPEEREALAAIMEREAPLFGLELDLACPECGHSFVAPFDTTAFFLEEMRVQAHQLLREVHTLAWCYHWSEAEILALSRDRRRAYLALVGDGLRRE